MRVYPICAKKLRRITPSSYAIVHFLPAAIVDSVEENIQASRCLLLLYNASTFKSHTSAISNNNNISEISDSSDKSESKHKDCGMSMGFDCEVSSNPRHQLEVVAAMHKALLESSLKVRKHTLLNVDSYFDP